MGRLLAGTTPLMAVLIPGLLRFVTGSCGGLQGDVMFILDASGSVGSANFQTMLQFVTDLVDDFDIGSDNVRVGVVKYESSVYTEVNLNSYYDKTLLKAAIFSIIFTGGGTDTASAISHMTSSMFTTTSGDRSDIPDVGIVITDGQSNVPTDTTTQAAIARSQGITMFAIGVGTGVSELNSIATDPDSDHVFTVSSFSGLASIESSFQTKACTSAVFNDAASTEDSSDNAAAIAGGVVAAVVLVVAVAAVGVVVYKKMGQTMVSKLAPPPSQVRPANQSDQPEDTHQGLGDEPSVPGVATDASTSMQPMSTRWPARLPPIPQ